MPGEPEPKSKPRKRWGRRLGVALLIFSALGIWVNGPGARWAVEGLINDQLNKNHLSGDFTVSGTLLGGITLKDVSLDGEQLVKQLKAEKIALSWSLTSLLNKHLDAIDIHRLSLDLDFDAPKPTGEAGKEEDPVKSTSLSDTLDMVRGIVGPAEISITDLKLDTTIAGLNPSLTLESLSHASGEDSYHLTDLTLTDHLGRVATNQVSTLKWNQDTVTLDQLDVLQDLGLRDIEFRIEGGVSGDLLIAGSRISATSNFGKEFAFTLESPPLEIKKLAALYDPEIPAEGAITHLSLTQNSLKLGGENIRWEDHRIQQVTLKGSLSNQKINTSLDLVYQGDRITLEASGENGFELIDNATAIRLTFRDQLTANGMVVLNEDILQSRAKLDYVLTYPEVPEVTGSAELSRMKVSLFGEALEEVKLNAGFDIETSKYTADLSGNLSDGASLHPKLKGPLSLSATANGNLPKKIHRGTLDLQKLNLEDPQLSASAEARWDWPKNVTIPKLLLKAREGQVSGSLAWENDFLSVNTLKLVESGNTLLSADGKLPAPLDIRSLDDVLANKMPFEFTLDSQPLSFDRLRKFAPIPEKYKGVFEANLKLAGTLAKPQANGTVSLIDFHQTNQPKIPSADLRTTFQTVDQELIIDGVAREVNGPLLDLNGKIALLPAVWLRKEESPKNAAIDLRIQSPDLNLARIQPFIPRIRTLDGSLKTDVKITGTLANPQIFGEISAGIDRMILDDSPISDFRNSQFRLTFKDQTITVHRSSLMAAGGTLDINGQISIAGEEPDFDLSLNGRYFLLTRNEDYSFRGHPDLKLRGPLSKASITGSIAIAESLIYKDVEILPFGVPRTTQIPRPNLPTFSAPQAPGPSSLVPPPYGDWPLNVVITTDDPVLIRGNLAKGELTANARIRGTLGNPRPSGTITSTELTADLPFSDLEVTNAVITLQPDDYSHPLISLRGTSTVSQFTVQVFLSGPVRSPNLTLSSNPPLPESEIMLLLATGSPSASLEDRQVASQKALQYLLEGLRRRYANEDKSVLQRLLKNSKQIELSLGDSNQFTGRKFSSATLEISDQWDFTTQIDEEGQTRALVVFSIRFR